jgi:UDP-N-acetylglucosamine--N-acetylmuramyl-(pentapeptide) pyrophosphoryl-undecaprenol N-acetylglucosamine transferase
MDQGLKIILTGGGTMGSVTPLLAVAEELKKQSLNAEFLWLGTKNGPERKMVEKYGLVFKAIPSGKLRRYFSGWNFLDPFLIAAGFFKSLWIIFKFKPQVILSAGGFVGVPAIWAGWLLRVPGLIHQQDVKLGLANKLTAPFAKIITVTFPESLKYFPKAVVTANPVRKEIFEGNRERAFLNFKLEKDLPVLLVLGGGTGALPLNKIMIKAAPKILEFCQIIHITGGRSNELLKIEIQNLGKENPRYHVFDFLIEEMKDAYAAADLVISRAGMGTLTELAALGKPTILVPIPKSHQEDNTYYFKRNNAVFLLEQKNLTQEILVETVRELINNKVELENLSRNIKSVMKPGAAEAMVEEVLKILGKK